MPEKAFSVCIKDSVFIDPAAGSGNFLTETYLSLRRLENETIKAWMTNTMVGIDIEEAEYIKVSIGQFYGIEINDFAVRVAQTALWIAENQMLEQTKAILRVDLDFLPLKNYENNIVEGNALRLDWNDVVDRSRLSYIMGNPPFVGQRYISREQHDDIINVLDGWENAGKVDYVVGW